MIKRLGEKPFHQWELNRQISVQDVDYDEIHWWNKNMEKALVTEPSPSIIVPNILLQEAENIYIDLVLNDNIVEHTSFGVCPRPRPEDYVYTEIEIKRWKDLAEKIDKIYAKEWQIGTDNIEDKAINSDKIQLGAITGGKIKDGVISEGKLANNSVSANKLQAGAVTSEKIATEAVTTDKIAYKAIQEDRIQAGAVTSGKIKDGAVTTGKIADKAVATSKIQDGSITADKIKDEAITSGKIADKAVTISRLSDGVIDLINNNKRYGAIEGRLDKLEYDSANKETTQVAGKVMFVGDVKDLIGSASRSCYCVDELPEVGEPFMQINPTIRMKMVVEDKVSAVEEVIDSQNDFVDIVTYNNEGALNLPTATVTEIENNNLTFAVGITTDPANDQFEYYKEWRAEYVLTTNKDVTLNAAGGKDGYISYKNSVMGAEDWTNLPPMDLEIKANEPFEMLKFGTQLMGEEYTFNYGEVYFMYEFDFGAFFEYEFLNNNPDFEAKIGLRIYDPADETNSYAIGEYVYSKPALPTATAVKVENEDLTFALNFKLDEVTEEQLEYYGDWYVDCSFTLNKGITLNCGGGKDGYVSCNTEKIGAPFEWFNMPYPTDLTLSYCEMFLAFERLAETLYDTDNKYTFKTFYEDSRRELIPCGMFLEQAFLAANPDLIVECNVVIRNPENIHEMWYIGQANMIIDTLPNVEAVTTYYNSQDQNAYGYITDELNTATRLPSGWHSVDDICEVMGAPYGGIVWDRTDVTEEHCMYMLMFNTPIVNYKVQKVTFIDGYDFYKFCMMNRGNIQRAMVNSMNGDVISLEFTGIDSYSAGFKYDNVDYDNDCVVIKSINVRFMENGVNNVDTLVYIAMDGTVDVSNNSMEPVSMTYDEFNSTLATIDVYLYV